jgi:hypothetical protein
VSVVAVSALPRSLATISACESPWVALPSIAVRISPFRTPAFSAGPPATGSTVTWLASFVTLRPVPPNTLRATDCRSLALSEAPK